MINLKPTKFNAIYELVGGGISGADDGTLMEYRGKTPPTKSEIDAKYNSMVNDWEAQEYARKRQAEYPSITDVVVALAEKEEGDSTMWDDITAKRQAVKTKYKKG